MRSKAPAGVHAVAWEFNPEGGTKNFGFGTYSSHSELHQFIRMSRGIKRPKNAYGGNSLHAWSHGESFRSLVLNRFGGNGLYILDEPEAALSPTRQMALLSKVDQLVKANSQFIIATYSPVIMSYPNARLFQSGSDGISEVGNEDTEHYQVS